MHGRGCRAGGGRGALCLRDENIFARFDELFQLCQPILELLDLRRLSFDEAAVLLFELKEVVNFPGCVQPGHRMEGQKRLEVVKAEKAVNARFFDDKLSVYSIPDLGRFDLILFFAL